MLRNESTGRLKRLTVISLQKNYSAKFEYAQSVSRMQSLTSLCCVKVVRDLYATTKAEQLLPKSVDCAALPDHLREAIVKTAFQL